MRAPPATAPAPSLYGTFPDSGSIFRSISERVRRGPPIPAKAHCILGLHAKAAAGPDDSWWRLLPSWHMEGKLEGCYPPWSVNINFDSFKAPHKLAFKSIRERKVTELQSKLARKED